MNELAVLLPTYNAARYLKDSIDSILNQTFQDFHLYVYDDFSADNTAEIVRGYRDKRIFYVKNEMNLGIAKTLNRGLEVLLGKYKVIARMDADDWCYPQRFERQLKKLNEDRDLVLCGTQGYWVKNFNKLPAVAWEYPTDHKFLKLSLLFTSSFGHSSVIFSSKFLSENNLKYDESIETCEDWDLWIRIVERGKVANLPDFPMKYRNLALSNHRNPDKRGLHLNERCKIIRKHWSALGYSVDEKDLYKFHYDPHNLRKEEFNRILKYFINLYNGLNYDYVEKLTIENKEKLKYSLARNILKFWRDSAMSRFSPNIWLLIISKVHFMSRLKLVRSIIK